MCRWPSFEPNKRVMMDSEECLEIIIRICMIINWDLMNLLICFSCWLQVCFKFYGESVCSGEDKSKTWRPYRRVKTHEREIEKKHPCMLFWNLTSFFLLLLFKWDRNLNLFHVSFLNTFLFFKNRQTIYIFYIHINIKNIKHEFIMSKTSFQIKF
jgi:hypothetical protein